MTSLEDYMVVALADAIHRAMCHRGTKTPTCKWDKGDALLIAEDLHKNGWTLKRITIDPMGMGGCF